MQGIAKTLIRDGDVMEEVDLLGRVVEEDAGADKVEDSEKAKGVEEEAWRLLNKAVVNYYGSPVGTVAAKDPSTGNSLNYDQVFIRDFIPSALAFMLKGESEIVRNFLLHTLQLQVLTDHLESQSPKLSIYTKNILNTKFKSSFVPI